MTDTLRIYYVDDHDYHWPVGCCSVVMAYSASQAIVLLDEKLRERGLKGYADKPYTLKQLPYEAGALVILDGEY